FMHWDAAYGSAYDKTDARGMAPGRRKSRMSDSVCKDPASAGFSVSGHVSVEHCSDTGQRNSGQTAGLSRNSAPHELPCAAHEQALYRESCRLQRGIAST